MSNIQTQISNNIAISKGVETIIRKRINDCVNYISMGDEKPITHLEQIDDCSSDREKLVEIYNLSKALEVIQMNHKARVRELNESDED